MTHPIRPSRLAGLVLITLLAAACDHKIPDWPADGYTTLSEPAVHPVLFGPQGAALSATERTRLVQFVQGAGRGAAVTVAAGGPQAAARQQAVVGVLRSAGHSNITLVSDPSATETVQVSAAGPAVLWPKRCLNADGSLPEDLPLGCASDINLAQQVERRGDLFRGRQMGPAFANPSVRAAERYLQLPEAGGGSAAGAAGSGGAGASANALLPQAGASSSPTSSTP